jgi:hypothetical protein
MEDPIMTKNATILKRIRAGALAFGVAGLGPAVAGAEEAPAPDMKTENRSPQLQRDDTASDEIYRRDLMTPEEVDAYNQGVRDGATADQARMLQQHRERMDERARTSPTPPGNGGAEGPGTSTGGDVHSR